MASKHNSCLVVEDEPEANQALISQVRDLGFDAIHCTGLFTCLNCGVEPDVILFGQQVEMLGHEDPLSNLELLIRECQIPLLTPENHKNALLERFEDIHVYPNVKTAMGMISPLILNHAKRRNIRDEMVKAVNGINHLEEAEFSFQNLEEAQAMALLVATLAPEKKILRLGLTELFVNAVEHGNLAIGENEKKQLRENGTWMDEVKKRLAEPEYADKYVRLNLYRSENKIRIRIEDEGKGFDWQNRMQGKNNSPNTNKSGRGLVIVQKSGLDELKYQGAGNVVECSFSIKPNGKPDV